MDARGLVWAVGSTVHLGDGSTIDTGRPVPGTEDGALVPEDRRDRVPVPDPLD